MKGQKVLGSSNPAQYPQQVGAKWPTCKLTESQVASNMLILTLSKLDLKLWIWPTTFFPFTNLLWKHFCMYSQGLQSVSKTGCANPVVLLCPHTSWAGSMKARLLRWWPLPDDHLLHCNTWKAQHITTPSKPSHRRPPISIVQRYPNSNRCYVFWMDNAGQVSSLGSDGAVGYRETYLNDIWHLDALPRYQPVYIQGNAQCVDK